MHTDDTARDLAYFDRGTVLVENVLRPLHRGEAVDFPPEARIAHGGSGSITVLAGAQFLRVEGTGIIREGLASWLDASVWVRGDLDEQERVLVARDGDSPEQLEPGPPSSSPVLRRSTTTRTPSRSSPCHHPLPRDETGLGPDGRAVTREDRP